MVRYSVPIYMDDDLYPQRVRVMTEHGTEARVYLGFSRSLIPYLQVAACDERIRRGFAAVDLLPIWRQTAFVTEDAKLLHRVNRVNHGLVSRAVAQALLHIKALTTRRWELEQEQRERARHCIERLEELAVLGVDRIAPPVSVCSRELGGLMYYALGYAFLDRVSTDTSYYLAFQINRMRKLLIRDYKPGCCRVVHLDDRNPNLSESYFVSESSMTLHLEQICGILDFRYERVYSLCKLLTS